MNTFGNVCTYAITGIGTLQKQRGLQYITRNWNFPNILYYILLPNIEVFSYNVRVKFISPRETGIGSTRMLFYNNMKPWIQRVTLDRRSLRILLSQKKGGMAIVRAGLPQSLQTHTITSTKINSTYLNRCRSASSRPVFPPWRNVGSDDSRRIQFFNLPS
jgi:hypothetical protein